MSIDKRISPLFKVREDLNRTETARRHIKVLTDLRVLLCPACYRHAGPYGPEEGLQRAVARFFPCCLKQDEQDLQDGQDEQDARGLGAAALGAKASLLWVREPEDNPRAKWIRDCSGSTSLGP